MKKLLIMIGLIGSVYGSTDISSWEGLKNYCTEGAGITETICDNSVTFEKVYTLKTDNASYLFNLRSNINMPASTKLVIPDGITLTLYSNNYSSYYMNNNSAIEIIGTLNTGRYLEGLTGPNEEGTESNYTNAYISLNGGRLNNEGDITTGFMGYSRLNFSGSGTINNNGGIYTSGSSSSITFSGTGGITNTGTINIGGNYVSITFSNTGDIINTGKITIPSFNASITVSEGTTIRNKGGKISHDSSSANISLILNGTLILEKGEGETGKYPLFDTEVMESEKSSYIVISGSGTIDMSPLRNADMTANSNSTTQGCINIPKESFSTSFTGTIKLPFETTCQMLDLSNASSVEEIYYDGNPLDKEKGTLWANAAGRIAGDIDFSSYNITLSQKSGDLPKALDLYEVIASEYNSQASQYYLVTNDLEGDVFDTGTSEYNIYFDLQGTKPIDFVGRGILNFYGDNRGYMPTHPSSIYPKVNFLGDHSIFSGVTVFKEVTFKEGMTIPAGATVIPQNTLALSDLTVKGHLVI